MSNLGNVSVTPPPQPTGKQFTGNVVVVLTDGTQISAPAGNAADQAAIAAFPQMAWALKDPELGPVLRAAAAQGWDAARLEGVLQKTKWYQTHNQAARAWADLSANDPAEAASRVQAETLAVRNAAGTLGVTLTDQQVSDLATQVLTNGLDVTEVNNTLAGYLPGGANAPAGAGVPTTGTAGYSVDQMRAEAAKYMVPISDPTLDTFARQMAQGTLDMQGFDSYLAEQAKSLFPGMAAAIDAGVTPQQYVDPYKQLAAQTLEIAPDSINMMDPKWSKAIFQVDGKTGARTSMSLSDWQDTLRSDPTYGYQFTNQARTQAYDMVNTLAKALGATA